MDGRMISVDRWYDQSQAYFLTHLHSDHTRGLSSTWKTGPLYCCRTTARLLPYKFPGFSLSLLRVLHVGSWHSLSLSSPSTGSPIVVEVVAVDANHCPGAVMFLFRGEFGHMLYTGDFRWETSSERSQRARTTLLDALNGSKIDVLHLDNTYCNPSYCFPSREVAAQQIVDIIAFHPEHDVIIGVDSLGKEDLLLRISHVLNIKIWVWPERLQTMDLLGLPDVFTTQTSLTRVRAVPRYSFSIDTLEGLNTMRPTIGIMPSGLPWVVKPLTVQNTHSSTYASMDRTRQNRVDRTMRCVQRIHEYIYSVPYSDHACFPELKEFVNLIQPSHMKAIVSMSASYVDPVYYLGHLLSSKHLSFSSNLDVNEPKGKRVLAGRKGKSPESDYLGFQVSRVTILRRVRRQRGVKIVETDNVD